MDNFGNDNFSNQNLNDPIPKKDELDKPAPSGDDDTGETSVSHSPLNLGGSGTAPAPNIKVSKPVEKRSNTTPQNNLLRSTSQAIPSTDRITGVRTFFTKLHPGAMEFLDEQITKWLKENPSVVIKRTNTVTGEIQAKKTEPNIIITVWY